MTIKIAESMADILEYVKIYQTYETAFKYHNTAAGKTAYDLIMLLHKDIRGFCQQAKQYYEKNWASMHTTSLFWLNFLPQHRENG
jgi:hypothetical protein